MILNPFKGKKILITGGSKGIGLAMAREFAQQGAHLALIARDKDALQAAARSLEAIGQGSRIRTYSCDVTDKESLADAVNMSAFELGGLDGVVANSGYCHPGNFDAIALEDFDRQIDVNLRGVIYTLHFALPYLLQNAHGGFIAITSSPAGNAGIYGFSAYGPTKAALNNLADTLRYEYGDRNVRVHLLLPPDTDTPGYKEEVKLYPPETKAILEGGTLVGPEFVAAKFVRGIANHKRRVAVGAEARFLLVAMRFMPKLWDWYTAAKKRSARKQIAKAAKRAAREAETAEDAQEVAEREVDSAINAEDPAITPSDDDVLVTPDETETTTREANT